MNTLTDQNYTIQEIVKLTPYLDDMEVKLTNKQRAFIYYYVINGFRKVDACRRAGYNCKKGKKESMQLLQQANQNLNLPYIKQARDLIISHIIKDKKEIEKKLFEIWYTQATYDPAMFYNPDGTVKFKTWEEVPRKYRCCIEKMEEKYYGKDGNVKVIILTLADKKFAQQQLDKYIQMTKETIDLNQDVNIIIGLKKD